jgi:hypothetical protein
VSYLVEQSPCCDLLRLSLLTRRFVRFRRTHLRKGAWFLASLLVLLLGPPAPLLRRGWAFFFGQVLRIVVPPWSFFLDKVLRIVVAPWPILTKYPELLWPHGRIVVPPWPILRKVLRIVVAPWQNCCGPMADFEKSIKNCCGPMAELLWPHGRF